MTTKKCSHCESEIQAEAKKCRYCKEWLNDDEIKNLETKEKEGGLLEKNLQSQQDNEIRNIKQKDNKKTQEGDSMESFYQKQNYNKISSDFVSKKIFYIAFMVLILLLLLSWGIFLNFKNTLTKELSDKVSIKEFRINIEGSDMKLRHDDGMEAILSWGKSDKYFTNLNTYLGGYGKCRFVGFHDFSDNGVTIGILGNRVNGNITFEDKSDEFRIEIREENNISFYKMQNNRVDTWSSLSDSETRNLYFQADILCIK